MVDFSALDRTALTALQMPEDQQIYYTPVGGSQVKLDNCTFESPSEPVVGTDLRFDGVGPQFHCHRDDVPNLAQDDVFTRAGVAYVVTDVDKDEGYIWTAFCRLA